MQIANENDFKEVRLKINHWYQKFPMFRHDIVNIEKSIEEHIKEFSINMVHYRQTKKQHFLESANNHITEINRIISLTEKMELMALLSQG